MDADTEKPETRNAKLETPVPLAGGDPLADSAAAVAQAVDRNTALAAGHAPPAASSSSTKDWHQEPADNFELDDAGGVKLRANGTPVRKPGRPRRARPGDKLADGSVKGGGGSAHRGGAAASMPPREDDSGPRVVIPELDDGGDGGADVLDDAAGEELGRVVGQGLGNVVDGLAGGNSKKKMTSDEKSATEKHLAAALAGVRVSPWVAVLVILAFYFARVWIETRREKPKQVENTAASAPQKENADAPAHHRPDPLGEKHRRTPALPGVASKIWGSNHRA